MKVASRFALPVPALLMALAFSPMKAVAAPFKVGLVLDKGGKDDKSFNAAAYKGATQAEKELKIELKTVEMTDSNSAETLVRSLASRKYDLIVAIGFSQGDAIRANAGKFPDRRFLVVDAEVDAKNVKSVLFQEHEGSFLAGALAAMASKSGKVGFIGGMDVPLIRRFAMGYEAGVKHQNRKAAVTVHYVGVTGDAWNNPTKAKELALNQFAAGVDVIFGAAGNSTTGVFDAAEEKRKLAIGVDSNQNGIKPGTILSSMTKRVDLAVYRTIKDAVAGSFTPGISRLGLTDDGVDLAMDEHNKSLVTATMRDTLAKLKKDIVAGTVKVPDYYRDHGKK